MYLTILQLLADHEAEYRPYRHRLILSYADAEAVRVEVGFAGVEGKCLVLRAGEGFAVCVTLAGRRVDLRRVRDRLGGAKVRLATAGELRDRFGAEPGNAYPFGFDAGVAILIDPDLFVAEWVLFSPALTTATIQVRGRDLARIFEDLPNRTVVMASTGDGSA